MRVLLTGATGFVGSHCAAALVNQGHEVRALVRSPDKLRSVLVPHHVDVTDVITGDVTDEDAVKAALAGCDAVIHTAGVVGIDRSKQAEMTTTNVSGTRNVLSAAVGMGIGPVVYTSTVSALFPASSPVMGPESPIGHPQNAYARSKATAEAYVRELQAAGAPVISVYPGGVMGPDDPGYGEVMRALPLIVKGGVPLTSGGFLTVDVRDVAAVLVASLACHRPARFMAGAHFQSWGEVAAIVSAASGRRVLRWPVPGVVLRTLGRGGDLLKAGLSFDLPLTHEAMSMVTQSVPTDNSLTTRELGVEFRPPVETYRDALRWLVQQGHLAARFAPAIEG